MRFNLLIAVFSFLLLGSCNNESKEKELLVNYEDESNELFDFEAISLAPYQINALIYLPDETADIGAATEPKIIHELNDYRWDILLGQYFHMRIVDYGEGDGIAIHLEELEELSYMYDIEYIERKADFIYYKRTLKPRGSDEAAETVGVEHVTYHCLANHRIGGINYIFRSNNDGLSKPIAKYMVKSIRSVEEIKPEI